MTHPEPLPFGRPGTEAVMAAAQFFAHRDCVQCVDLTRGGASLSSRDDGGAEL